MAGEPRASVIMGAYNCAGTIDAAIRSVVEQSFRDWEFVICDDASTDDTAKIIRAWAERDSRIRLIHNTSNLGLAVSLDNCISESRAEILIRQDADDLSVAGRFEKLIMAIDCNASAGVVGSWVTCFDETGELGVIRTAPNPTKADLLEGTIFFHPSCAMRKRTIVNIGCYGNEPWLRRSQDYYLWFRLYASGGYGINLQESLYYFREDQAAWKRRSLSARWMESRVRWEGYKLIGAPFWMRPLAFVPLLKCLVPGKVYAWIRKSRLQRSA